MNNDPKYNTATHDWNKVLMAYCDGSSYSGKSVACLSAAAPRNITPLPFYTTFTGYDVGFRLHSG